MIFKEGEVFIQIKTDYVKDVIVTKNPCLHLGNIKLLKAVELEKLNHMINVIVFPKYVNRPIHNEISAGDLDEHYYFVS